MKVTIEQHSLHWEAAHALARAAVEKAVELEATVNVAVVDGGGHLAAFLRMPGSPFHSIDIAIDKAYTALSFGVPTSRWEKMMGGLSAPCRTSLAAAPRLMTCGGGVPLEAAGRRVGAVGVSGASERQDEEIALAAAAVLPGAEGGAAQ